MRSVAYEQGFMDGKAYALTNGKAESQNIEYWCKLKEHECREYEDGWYDGYRSTGKKITRKRVA